MSTNSGIIVQHPISKTYASIYCHSDGYLQHNGVILHQCFTTLEQVVALVSLGDLSYLGNSYETALSYYRWRKDPIKINIGPILEDHIEYEYSYLFRDGEWFVKFHRHNWKPLLVAVSGMLMPNIADTSDRWDGETRYLSRDLQLLEGWTNHLTA